MIQLLRVGTYVRHRIKNSGPTQKGDPLECWTVCYFNPPCLECCGPDAFTFTVTIERGRGKNAVRDYTASEDDNVLVQGVEGNKFALGYIPYAYFAPHSTRMKAVAVQWAKNKVQEPVLPSPENVIAGTYNPLSRPLFIYVSKKSMDKPEVKEFVEFYLANVKTLATEVKYVSLTDPAYEMAKTRLQTLQVGSGFGGHPEVGLPVEELLKRTPKL